MSNKKEIFKNFFSFGVIDFLGLLVPILTMPILTRTLGAEGYGVYLLILSILFFGHTIVDYGTQFTSVREVANAKTEEKKLQQIFIDTQSVRLILSIVYSILCIVYSYLFLDESLFPFIVTTAPIYLIGYALTPVWFYQGLSQMLLVTKVSFVVRLANVFIILCFVREVSDLQLALLSISLPMMLGGIFLTYDCKNNRNLNVYIHFNIVAKLKSGVHVFIGLLAPNFYNSMPTIFLGTTYPPEQFAKFAVASRLCQVVVTLQNVLSKALFPILARMRSSKVNGMIMANILVSLPPLIVISFFGEYILGVFLGSEFSTSNQYLIILTVGVFFIGLANAFSQGFFLPNGLDSMFRNISLRVSFVSGLLAVILVDQFGLLGGAFAITVARLLFFVDYSVTYYKSFNTKDLKG